MDTSLDHFDDEDLKMIAELQKGDGDSDGLASGTNDSGTQANADNGGQSTQTEEAGTAEANDTNTQGNGQDANAGAQASGAGSTETQQADRPAGDLRQALRSARRNEKSLKQQLEQVLRENAELKSKLPEGMTDANGDPDMAALEADYPAFAAVIKKQQADIAELRRSSASGASGQHDGNSTEFTPPVLPVEVQEVVDDIPELLAMQLNPDQTGWKLAVQYDASLRADPDWSAKPDAERFAEAARRALQKTGGAKSTPTEKDAAEAARARAAEKAAQAGRRAPESLSDFGAAGNTPEGANLSRYQRMSEEDIVADLLRGG